MPSLTHLSLYRNNLSPSFPFAIPQLMNLSYLALSENELIGPIPYSLAKNSPYLEYLNLSYDNFSGEIPSSFQSLTRLRFIPVDIGKLKDLISLHLASNRFTGSIPHTIGELKKLKSLHLDDNDLTGTIPIEMGNMLALATLKLSMNRLEGNLPGSLGDLPKLKFVSAYLNKFTGIEPNFSKCRSLKYLALSYNHFSGEFPQCLWDVVGLEYIDLHMNNISTMGPGHVVANSFLKELHLTNNSLTGEFLVSLKHCKKLILLDLEGNKLSRELPKWIGDEMQSLAILQLRSNLFHGDILPELFRLPELHVLDLSENNFSGNIPPELGSITSMQKERQYVVSRDYNIRCNLKIKWKGKYYNFPTKYLTTIDLSSNHLSGQIPEDITNLLGLVALNLANNYLDGNIPTTIGNMKQLESPDLSMNRLTGPIPPSLASLNFLSWLNVSYNNLSGPIPTGPQLQTLNDHQYIEEIWNYVGMLLAENALFFQIHMILLNITMVTAKMKFGYW
ncbi:Serine/threonine-protein kinase BRI1-like 2 [Carex littledalei]|uniref:Serine/threonine-protein kinase BRI1-like 2 n=1 Tax=Carex littledalei TaxID=544730 RepID=A0A833QS05_9POAL|nr:Serine/threonine-protein kinase BRI1-like 2 [Carex littledalei]